MTAPSAAAGARRAGPATVVGTVLLFVVVSVLAGLVVAAALLPYVGAAGVAARSTVESFEALPSTLSTPPLPQRSVVLAADGSVLATIYYQNRVEIPLSEVAPVMRQAIVAVEDGRFYEHHGVDLHGVVRALVGNAGGSNAGGGSTITQQYVKNVLVESAATPQQADDARARTITRKLREMRLAIALERTMTKDQILEGYLNIAYFGAGAYGVEAASRRYFGKDASKLTLVEAATLAGTVQQPGAYDPIRHPDASAYRRTQVLNRMVAQGDITQAVADQTAAIPTKSIIHPSTTTNGCTTSFAPFFCDYVLQVMRTDPAFGATPDQREALLQRGGLTIRTTLDPVAQRAAQKAVDDHIPRKDKSGKVAAISMVRPGTGEIVAMAENRSWGTTGAGNTTYNFNVGTAHDGWYGAQAGSTFKAFTLAAALDQGLVPNKTIINAPHQKYFPPLQDCSGNATDGGTVRNSTRDGTFNMLQGTAYSVNTYFMGLEQKTGVCEPFQVASALGVTHGDGTPLGQYLNFTIGTNEVTPLSMAEAYATFAAHGVHCTSIAIASVTDRDGKSMPVPRGDCRQVVDRGVADGVALILKGVIDGPIKGRTGAAMSLGRDAAGKTGTTNNSVAVWFIGFTPDLAAAVWTGDPRGNQPKYAMKNLRIGGKYFSQVFGSTLPGPIWKQAMLGALAKTPPTKFDLLPKFGTDAYLAAPHKPPVVVPPGGPGVGPTGGPTGGPTPGPTPTATPPPNPSPSPSPSPTKHGH